MTTRKRLTIKHLKYDCIVIATSIMVILVLSIIAHIKQGMTGIILNLACVITLIILVCSVIMLVQDLALLHKQQRRKPKYD